MEFASVLAVLIGIVISLLNKNHVSSSPVAPKANTVSSTGSFIVPMHNINKNSNRSMIYNLSTTSRPEDIRYNMGAPVLTKDVTIHLIFYGSNWSETQKSITQEFVRGIGSTPWYNINRKYYYQKNADSPREYIRGAVRLGTTVSDTGSLGTRLRGNAIPNWIQRAVKEKILPEEDSAIYAFLVSGEITEKVREELGNAYYCIDYCGYHVSWLLESGTRVKYALAGLPKVCLDGCAPPQNQYDSPNHDVYLDGMIDTLAHELAEAISDPESDGNRAWEDGSGDENCDKCMDYGSFQITPDYAYNMEFGGRRYMVQRNWDPELQQCVMNATTPF